MKNEIWKDIKGYEGLYQVSNTRKVKSLKRIVSTWNAYKILEEKELKPSIINNYYNIRLYKKGKHKNYTIHRLVAITFLSNPNNLPQVNHKDENKLNNNVDNLEWCTSKYNVNYGTSLYRRAKTQKENKNQINNKGTSKKVICLNNGIIYPSIHEASRQLKIDDSSISKICRKVKYRKSVNGFEFRFMEN